MAVVLWSGRVAVLLLSLLVCQRSSTHWSHVHRFPVCSHSMWYTRHACCHCAGPTIQCHGLLVHIRHRLCTPLLWSRVCASIKVVPAGFHHVSVLPCSLVVCWRSMVESHWPLVVNLVNDAFCYCLQQMSFICVCVKSSKERSLSCL